MQPYFWLGAEAEKPENWVPEHIIFAIGTPTTPENKRLFDRLLGRSFREAAAERLRITGGHAMMDRLDKLEAAMPKAHVVDDR
jgi:hypothetical protein